MYNSGYITSSVAPAPNYIINYLEPDMLSVGWVKSSTNVATNTANPGSNLVFNVYRSPNTVNSLGKDFYVAIGWDNASNANIAITVFEQYDNSSGGATSNTCLGYPPLQGVTRAIVGANLWCNTNISGLPNTPGGNCGYLISTVDNNLSTTSFKYYHSVTIDRVITCSSNTSSLQSGHAYYAGLYDSFINPVIDQYPICIVNLMASATQASVSSANLSTMTGLTTREPAAYTKGSSAQGQNFSISINGPLNRIGSTSASQFDAYANRALVSRIILAGRTTSAGGDDGYRGLLKDMYCHQAVFVPSNRGDTIDITVNGVKYNAVCARNTVFSSVYPYFLQV